MPRRALTTPRVRPLCARCCWGKAEGTTKALAQEAATKRMATDTRMAGWFFGWIDLFVGEAWGGGISTGTSRNKLKQQSGGMQVRSRQRRRRGCRRGPNPTRKLLADA